MPKIKLNRLGKRETTGVVTASAAGGGVGAAIAGIASAMSPNSPYKTVLTVTAPLIGVGVSGFWLFFKTFYVNPYIDERKRQRAKQKRDQLLHEARDMAKQAASNPGSTEDHKREMQRLVQNMEIKSLRTMTEDCK